MNFIYKNPDKCDITMKIREGVEIKGYSPEEFQKIKQKKEVQVVASTSFEKGKNGSTLLIGDSQYKISEPKEKSAFMYIWIGDDNYIECYKSKKIWIVLILLVAILIAGILLLILQPKNENKKEEPTTIEVEDNSSWDGELDTNKPKEKIEQEYTSIISYSNIWVGKEKPVVSLVNDKTNEVYLKYSVQEKDGTVIYETGNIAPGDAHAWKALDDLSAGEHELNFVISTIDIEQPSIACNGATNEVVITVEK